MAHPDYQPKQLILGSASPRRKLLLESLGLKFEVRTQASDESYPPALKSYEITNYLSASKANILSGTLPDGALLLTADTIVWMDNAVLGKPVNEEEARLFLERLSGRSHEVFTSVCFTGRGMQRIVHARTEVEFGHLDTETINGYIDSGAPMDKAGAYGIQDRIGLVGVVALRGSYTNVVGLPTHLVCNNLREMVRLGF